MVQTCMKMNMHKQQLNYVKPYGLHSQCCNTAVCSEIHSFYPFIQHNLLLIAICSGHLVTASSSLYKNAKRPFEWGGNFEMQWPIE